MKGTQTMGRDAVPAGSYVLLTALAMALLVLTAAAVESAAEPPGTDGEVDRALSTLEQSVDADASLGADTRDALRALVDALRAERSQGGGEQESAPPPSLSPALEGWERTLNRLSVYGDLRLRQESEFHLDDRGNRHRQRIRMRLGADYALTDALTIGGRIVTGDASDPNSPHQTLGNVFSDFEISLDRAFLRYRPEDLPGSQVTLGKFAHPFYRNPVYSELVWDADVQPEGGFASYRTARGDLFESLELIGGAYTILEQQRADDAFAGVVQGSTRLRLSDRVAGELAVGYYHYSDVSPGNSTRILGENGGNATIDLDGDGEPDDFRSDFGILNPILALHLDGWRWPVVVSGEYIHNLRASGSRDQGWAAGLSVGRNRQRGDVRAYYQWQLVEQDAVLSPFAQDDFLFQTNHRSHLFGMTYQILDPVGVNLWALVSRRDLTAAGAGSEGDSAQWRVRMDLDLKF